MSVGDDGVRGVVTPLMVAASRGDYGAALRLLATEDANACDRLGNTALIYAAAGGHAEVVRLLLNAGADAYAKNDAGISALDRAETAARRDAIEMLLAVSRGVRPDDVLTDLDARLIEACRAAAPATAAELISRGACVESRMRGSGWTPLINACASGSVETALVLLDAGADPSASAADGRTPLHFSAQLCDLELVSLLLARGADPNLRDRYGETPRATAERGGADDAARQLAAVGATI